MVLPTQGCLRRAGTWAHWHGGNVWRRCTTGISAITTGEGVLLTEPVTVTVTGYHRRALIRAWRRPERRRPGGSGGGRHGGAGPRHQSAAMDRVLAHIEQKNWTHVRTRMGRVCQPAAAAESVKPLNQLGERASHSGGDEQVPLDLRRQRPRVSPSQEHRGVQ